MSTLTEERLDYVLQLQRARNHKRASLQGFVWRAAIMLTGVAIMIATVGLAVGLKAFVFLSRMPAFH